MYLNQDGRVKQTTASPGQRRRGPTRFSSVGELRRAIANLRARLEPAFAPETAMKQSTRAVSASAGQCSAVATIIRAMLGGELVSAHVDTQSHWFNRIPVGGDLFDIDITGDQFGLPPIQMARRGKLYGGSRVRRPAEVDKNTRMRAALLARRARVGDDLKLGRSLDTFEMAQAVASLRTA
jgi:hypothetical protein